MTEETDKQIDDLVADLKKSGFNVVASGTAKDLSKLMEEGEYSDKNKEKWK